MDFFAILYVEELPVEMHRELEQLLHREIGVYGRRPGSVFLHGRPLKAGPLRRDVYERQIAELAEKITDWDSEAAVCCPSRDEEHELSEAEAVAIASAKAQSEEPGLSLVSEAEDCGFYWCFKIRKHPYGIPVAVLVDKYSRRAFLRSAFAVSNDRVPF